MGPVMTSTEDLKRQGRALVGQAARYAVRSRYFKQQSGTPDLVFPVKITDFRVAFGRLRVRIEPVDGEGHWWVEAPSAALRLESE